MSYQDYLDSDAWQSIRAVALHNACGRCGRLATEYPISSPGADAVMSGLELSDRAQRLFRIIWQQTTKIHGCTQGYIASHFRGAIEQPLAELTAHRLVVLEKRQYSFRYHAKKSIDSPLWPDNGKEPS
jgi:hypothetical protein